MIQEGAISQISEILVLFHCSLLGKEKGDELWLETGQVGDGRQHNPVERGLQKKTDPVLLCDLEHVT